MWDCFFGCRPPADVNIGSSNSNSPDDGPSGPGGPNNKNNNIGVFSEKNRPHLLNQPPVESQQPLSEPQSEIVQEVLAVENIESPVQTATNESIMQQQNVELHQDPFSQTVIQSPEIEKNLIEDTGGEELASEILNSTSNLPPQPPGQGSIFVENSSVSNLENACKENENQEVILLQEEQENKTSFSDTQEELTFNELQDFVGLQNILDAQFEQSKFEIMNREISENEKRMLISELQVN